MLTDVGNFIGGKLQNLFDNKVTDQVIDDLIKDICTQLIQSNVNPKYIMQMRTKIKEKIKIEKIHSNSNKARIVQNAVYTCLVELIDPNKPPYTIEKGKPNVVVFVGLQGAGKTTSICKYANFYKKKGFKVGIVCADTFRAGAYDQVKQNASKINVPFFGSEEADPVRVAREGVAKFRRNDFELILVDTSGRHTQEENLFIEMKDIMKAIQPNNIIFVMDAGIGQSAEEQANGFKNSVKVGGIILTKIDGASKAGGALSSVAATGCPIEFVGTGEKMENFEKFSSKTFISKLLGIPDIESFIERIDDLDINTEEMTDKFIHGSFTLGDFRNFYTQICSLGPLSNIIKMVPGMNKVELPDENKVKRINYIFDSMHKTELQSTGGIFVKEPNRVIRVANGSGTTKEQVNELLSNFKNMSHMAKKMMNMPGMAEMFGMAPSTTKGKKSNGPMPNLFNFQP